MRKLFIVACSALLCACNDTTGPNVENDKTMGVKDSASGAPGDTSITTDSRRNAPGTYDYINDTGNKTQSGGPKDAPYPTKPSNQ
jgi:hypothetical protein